jgi:hypothetical protein
MVRPLFRSLTMLIAVLATGCTSMVTMDPPAADGPRIADLEPRPASAVAGCPLVLAFAFDAGDDEIVQAVAAWSSSAGRRHSAGRVVLEVPPETFAGHPHGEVAARVVPPRAGRYSYYVQVEDRAGRKSNVLETEVPVGGWWGSGC